MHKILLAIDIDTGTRYLVPGQRVCVSFKNPECASVRRFFLILIGRNSYLLVLSKLASYLGVSIPVVYTIILVVRVLTDW